MSDAPSTSATPPEPLRAGRDALLRHAWVEAFEQLSKADREGQLNGADLESLALAAFFGAHADESTLGYSAQAMLGRRIEDFAAPALVASPAARWSTFATAGRQDGTFDMLHADGSVVRMRYQARAHYPIANFHLSRLWPDPEAS